MSAVVPPDQVQDLLHALAIPNWQTRFQAVVRLGQIPQQLDQRFFDALLPLATQAADDSLRHAAILALGAVDDPRVVDVVVTLFHQRATCFAAARALGILHTDAAIAILIAALGGTDLPQRMAAAEAFAFHGDDRATDALIAVLRDAESLGTTYALMALGRVRAAAAVTPLLTLLADPATHSGNARSDVLPYLLTALGQIGDPRAVDPLIALLMKPDDHSCWAAYALGAIGDPRAFDALLAATQSADRHLANWAASALGQVGDRRALKPLLALLQDPEETVRIGAAEGLGYLGDPAALPALTWALIHDDAQDNESGYYMATEAAAALERIASRHR